MQQAKITSEKQALLTQIFETASSSARVAMNLYTASYGWSVTPDKLFCTLPVAFLESINRLGEKTNIVDQ